MHMSTPSPSQSGLVAPVAGFPPPRCDDVYSIGLLWFWHCRAGFLLFLFWTKFGWNGWDGYVGYVGWVSNGFWRSKMFLFSCCTRFVKTDVMTTCRWHRDICKLYVGYLLIVIISVERASKKKCSKICTHSVWGVSIRNKGSWMVGDSPTRRRFQRSLQEVQKLSDALLHEIRRLSPAVTVGPWQEHPNIWASTAVNPGSVLTEDLWNLASAFPSFGICDLVATTLLSLQGITWSSRPGQPNSDACSLEMHDSIASELVKGKSSFFLYKLSRRVLRTCLQWMLCYDYCPRFEICSWVLRLPFWWSHAGWYGGGAAST